MKIAKTCISTLFLVIAILIFSSCKTEKNQHITIATAANMQFAMNSLVQTFTKQTGIQCQLIIGSSGKLTAQIKEGAPYDLFVAANLKYPEEIQHSNLAVYPPKVYAYGTLVLWSMNDSIQPSINRLMHPKIHHIALANPKTAPYGVAAIETLQNYDIYDTILNKLVYGESIAQTNQFITSKSAEIGFTSKSVVLSAKMKGKGNWSEIDPAIYSPIKQGVVLINQKSLHPNAEKFYEFLFSKEAKKILEDFGYLVSQP
ncbi:molybdate ABC transporter substrate-binding protein [Aquimarina sp. 2201CG5-10]|uniref:molybdate ABC transporter substrate-binding protein n=1 Tax=Aquimarina callyspongiae TaxID=3098150 RepID=UPI002AB32AF3|nr:molybdate ABC transporter substrate-binding protein [Aquimarina sp. 2201CG5-10]MDY8137178.1 molybdate ABC transporter substrate-binding protein [Aquimarina sp. 2201CG5-10]